MQTLVDVRMQPAIKYENFKSDVTALIQLTITYSKLRVDYKRGKHWSAQNVLASFSE